MKGSAEAILLTCILWAAPAWSQATLEEIRSRAVQGDYDAERSLASCLGEEPGECPIEPAPDPVQACAWRTIIVTSEHPKVGDADVEAYQRDCGFQTLGQLEQAAALAEAQRLFLEIYKREMPLKLLLPVGR